MKTICGGKVMIGKTRMCRFLLLCFLLPVTTSAQQSPASITVTGTTAEPLMLTAADLAPLIFVAADADLVAAASAEGLDTENPNLHVTPR